MSLPATQARLDRRDLAGRGCCGRSRSLLVLAAITVYVIGGPGDQASTDTLVFLPVVLLTILGYSTVGAILASRNTRNPMGWIMLTVGLAFAFAQATETYAKYTLEIDPGVLPFGAVAAWFGTWDYAVAFCALLVLAQLYPSGRVLSPRWRKVPWIVVAAASVASVGTALGPGTLEVETGFAVDNPFGLEAIRPIVEITGGIGWIVLLASVPVSIASLVLRFRRSEGESRQQIRWLAFIAVAVVASLLLAVAAVIVFGERFDRSIGPEVFFGVIFSLIGVGVPAAMGVAVLKYRLYDLDLVIKKTIVFAILVLLLLALVGVGALLLGGTLVPSLYDRPPLLVVFGVVFGLLVDPGYRLARRIADRVVYGGRASPTKCSRSSPNGRRDVFDRGRLAEDGAADRPGHRSETRRECGSRSAPSCGRGRLAGRGDREPVDALSRRRTARLPRTRPSRSAIKASCSAPSRSRCAPSDPMNPSKERIVGDLASQTGLVLRNVRLIEELRESRRRIVTAQDERAPADRTQHPRRRAAAAGRARGEGGARRAPRRPDARRRVSDARAGQEREPHDALENLRDLARGIYPPLLADQGLAAALERAGPEGVDPGRRRAGRDRPLSGRDGGRGVLLVSRGPAERHEVRGGVEGDRTARPVQRHPELRGERRRPGLRPGVVGHGTGLQGIADRLASLGGELDVRSAPGDGTTVAGRLPVIEEGR